MNKCSHNIYSCFLFSKQKATFPLRRVEWYSTSILYAKMTKREKFFSESLRLIHQRGFKATTMRDIAQVMDFEVANVYNYIESKHSLLETYLFGISSEFHQGIEHIENSTLDSKERIAAIVSLHVNLASSRPFEVALLINEWRHLKEGRLDDFLNEKSHYENRVRAIVAAGIKNGELRGMNEEIATQCLLSSVRWVFDWFTSHPDQSNPVEIENQITNFVIRGLSQD